MKLLLYCTKAKPNIVRGIDNEFYISNASKKECIDDYKINGKIVAECDYEVEEIEAIYCNKNVYDLYHSFYRIQDDEEWLNKACLNMAQLDTYLKGKNGYAIHIKNLHIFDKPKNLYDYGMDFPVSPIVKAPQNMMYANGINGRYILISIRPEWLCKILNGEKTIEIRKKVLKEML